MAQFREGVQYIDFNIKSKGEQGYINSPFLIQPQHIMANEIDAVMNISETEVLCDNGFGNIIEPMLFEMGLLDDTITNRTNRYIHDNCSMADYFNVDVSLYTMDGSKRNIGIIDITATHPELGTVEEVHVFK